MAAIIVPLSPVQTAELKVYLYEARRLLDMTISLAQNHFDKASLIEAKAGLEVLGDWTKQLG